MKQILKLYVLNFVWMFTWTIVIAFSILFWIMGGDTLQDYAHEHGMTYLHAMHRIWALLMAIAVLVPVIYYGRIILIKKKMCDKLASQLGIPKDDIYASFAKYERSWYKPRSFSNHTDFDWFLHMVDQGGFEFSSLIKIKVTHAEVKALMENRKAQKYS